MAVIYAQGAAPGYGTLGNDIIYGDGASNTLYGNFGRDRLYGGEDNDYLAGGAGRDTLTGGNGYDDFHFGGALSKTSVDIITDYNRKYDTILLSKWTFKDIGRANTWMKPSAFWQGTKAHDSNDRIIYNPKNGTVYYDPDGTGSKEAIPFVKIGAGRNMSSGDFWVESI